MNLSYYKLNEYKLIEFPGNDVFWRSHYGFGGFREGKCYIKGTILFIGPVKYEGDGSLKGEFLEKLDLLSEWDKTIYYCRHFNIYHCRTGKPLSEKDMLLWKSDRFMIDNHSNVTSKSPPEQNTFQYSGKLRHGHYRLGNNEIMVDSDTHISWKTIMNKTTVRVGSGFILEDILFLNRDTTDHKSSTDTPHHRRLEQIPIWDKSTYYAVNTGLMKCTARSEPVGFKQNLRSALFRNQRKAGIWSEVKSIPKQIVSECSNLDITALTSSARSRGRLVLSFLNAAIIFSSRLSVELWKELRRFRVRKSS